MSPLFWLNYASGTYLPEFPGEPCCLPFVKKYLVTKHVEFDCRNMNSKITDSQRAALRERLKHVKTGRRSKRPAVKAAAGDEWDTYNKNYSPDNKNEIKLFWERNEFFSSRFSVTLTLSTNDKSSKISFWRVI